MTAQPTLTRREFAQSAGSSTAKDTICSGAPVLTITHPA